MIQNILPHLHYFWRVAKEKSFTQAAKTLRISQSAVSFQIKKLEEKLGKQLFLRRAKNRVALNPDGLKLAEYCQRIFQEVQVGLDQLLGRAIQGNLVVTGPGAFGSIVMAPMLKALRQKYPKLNVELRLTDAVLDFQKENVDLAIRWGAYGDPKLNYQYIMHTEHVLVASKEYLHAQVTIRKPKDIEDHTTIIRRLDKPDWQNWFHSIPKTQQPKLKKSIMIDSSFGMLHAAKAGLGICALPYYVAFEDIQSGKLQIVLPRCCYRAMEPFYACYPKSPYPLPKVEAFIETLKKYLKKYYPKKGFAYLTKQKSPVTPKADGAFFKLPSP